MRILITGGAGFIGSHLAHHFTAGRHTVMVIDDLSRGARANVPARAELVPMSITDPALARVVSAFRPEAVCHHAAQVNVHRSVEDPSGDAHTNVLGTIRVAEAAALSGAHTLLFASSGGAIYGEQEVIPAGEGHSRRPTSPYGVAKLCGESYLDYFARSSGIRTVHLRYANVYGPCQDPRGEAGAVAVFAQRMLRGEGITIHGDGLQTRDYVYVGDVVRANALALANPRVHGPLNIGTGVETSVLELAAALGRITRAPGKPSHGPARPGEQRRSVLAIERARSELGWAPQTALREGLALTAAWFQRQRLARRESVAGLR
jgi:UDP-glucose 4-epimerase